MGSGGDESQPSGDGPAAAVLDAVPDALGRREFVLVGAVGILLAAVALGMGPVGGETDASAGGGSTATPAPTPTPTATPPATASGAGANATAERAPAITMQIRSVDSCGSRCRQVTVALSNEGGTAASDVRVETTMRTGDTLVWAGRSDVGRLAAGETATRTRTIQVGYADAARIEANDGVVRIETAVRTANGTQTFTQRRDVT